MKNKVLKVIVIFCILIILLQISSFATLTPREINGNTTISSELELKGAAENILGIIDLGGTILAITIMIIIGIQYMKSSLEQKAQYKEKLIPYAIGCLLLFAAPKIASAIYKIAIKI